MNTSPRHKYLRTLLILNETHNGGANNNQMFKAQGVLEFYYALKSHPSSIICAKYKKDRALTTFFQLFKHATT